ncbi:MAG: hypothetical protein H5T86_02155, partial [Armatimonadetes bacterium]|nr:hypothetical protein [Armatimonadota bacterium]
MNRRRERSIGGLMVFVSAVCVLVFLPSVSRAAISLGFNGAGVWPQVASENSQRWFRFHITWSENEMWTLQVTGFRLRFDLDGNGARDGSITLDMNYPYVRGLAAGENPGSVGVVVNSLGTRDIMVTIGPFASPFSGPETGGIQCFRPNTIGAIGGPSTSPQYFDAYWTHWSSGGNPTTDHVQGWYGVLPDNDDALQWYSGPAVGVDPLAVDPRDPNNPSATDNGSSSSRYIFRVRYQTHINTVFPIDWSRMMRCRWMGYDNLGVPPDENSSIVDLDRARYDFVRQRFAGFRYHGGYSDDWFLHPQSDAWEDRQGYQTSWQDGGVLLVIDEDYD